MGEFNHTRRNYNYKLKFKGLQYAEAFVSFKFGLVLPIWCKINLKSDKDIYGSYIQISIKFGKDISELNLIYFPKYRCYGVNIMAVGNKYNKSDEQYIWEL